MADIKWNKEYWSNYGWSKDGEEWSLAWGNVEAHWFGSMLPRLHSFLPADSILEIAPGYGRWTQFLIPASKNYTGIDLAENCIFKCRDKFGESDTRRFYVNDGLSLEAAYGNEYQLIFSFDSLVHADISVLESYIGQILKEKMLSYNGVAFIHHSNLRFARQLGINCDGKHARDPSVSFMDVENFVNKYGGKVLVQELIKWGPPCLDCITVFCSNNSLYANKPKMLFNNVLGENEISKQVFSNYIFGFNDQ